jgi:hypothetical protein
MAQYRLKERSFLAGQLLEPGTVIGDGTQYAFDGNPGPHMEPLDSGARLAVKKWQESLAPHDSILGNHPEDKSIPGFQMRRP